MYFTLLRKNQSLFYYLASTGITNLGNVMTGLAFLFLAFDLTESSLHVTGVAATQVIPYLLFGLVGGVLADWVPKRKWLIRIEVTRAPLLLVLVMFYYIDLLAYWHLIAVSFIIHLFGCFFNPAHRALLPLITEESERTAANSLLDTVTRGMTVIGPIISILFIQTIGVIHFFTLDALTYLVSAWLLAKVKLEEARGRQMAGIKFKSIFFALNDFRVWLKNVFVIRRLFVVTGIIVFLHTWVWQVGLLLMLHETMSEAEAFYSMLLSVFGGTVIFVNLLIPYLVKQFTLPIYFYSAIVWGSGIVVLSLASGPIGYFIGMIVSALGLPLSGLARVYLLQKFVPREMLGRGFSFNAVLLYAANLLSLALFAGLATFIPISSLFLGSGLLMVCISVLYLLIHFRNALGVKP